MTLLRDGVLDGRGVVLAGGVSASVRDTLAHLGARIETLPAPGDAEDAEVGTWAQARSPLHALVHFASRDFGAGGRTGLDAALAGAWSAIREVAVGELIPRGAGGKVVLIAPQHDAGAFAQAARAGLENLARTLSIEWARYGVTTTMIAPGASTGEAELSEFVCYLVSEAGDYFSGCRWDVRAVSPT